MNTEQNLENINNAQFVDGFGNPIDTTIINNDGSTNSENTQYVDQYGNPIDPSLIDASGNYIGDTNEVQTLSLDQTDIATQLSSAAGSDIGLVTAVKTNPIHTSEHQMDDKEMFSGMVTFDYNNVPITDIVNSIILDAINKGASDIHFDPFDDGIKIRIRIDGELNDYSIVPLYVKKNMITRIKIISGMNITESRIPQDGAIRTELANKTIDLRVSCLPTNLGEKLVVRIMDYSMSAAGIEGLDFSEDNLEKVKKMLDLPNGIILVTGATGSGKSTTVYSMLQRINTEQTNILTVEDPIEMNISGVNQVQAVSEIGLDFATVLRSILRQDPDVIMIGEIRDEETAKIAVRASITGHLVLSTIHTNNSLNTIERLTDMNVERYLLGSALSGIVSQKLSRRLCDKCRKLRPTNEYEKEMFKKILDKDIEEIYEPVGCPECSRGYRGRIAVQEVLLLNQTIKDAIIKGASKAYLRKLVYGSNETVTMLADGLNKVLEGKTSFEEVLKLIDLDDDLGTGSEMGLDEQIDATQMTNNYGYGMPQYAAPANLSGPININITPELLAGLQGLQVPQVNTTEVKVSDATENKNVASEEQVEKDEIDEAIEDIDNIIEVEDIIDSSVDVKPETTEDLNEDVIDVNEEEKENIEEVVEEKKDKKSKKDKEDSSLIKKLKKHNKKGKKQKEEKTKDKEEIVEEKDEESKEEIEVLDEIKVDDEIKEENIVEEEKIEENTVNENDAEDDDDVLDLLLDDNEDLDDLLNNITGDSDIDFNIDDSIDNLSDEDLDDALNAINADNDDNNNYGKDDETDEIISSEYDSIDDDIIDGLLDEITSEDE